MGDTLNNWNNQKLIVMVRKFRSVRFSFFFCGFGRSGRPMGSTNAWGCTIVTRTPRKYLTLKVTNSVNSRSQLGRE
jgi:hypothetical protein